MKVHGWAWWVGLALPGCILTEDVPEALEASGVTQVDDFELICASEHYDRALGCVLTCGEADPVSLALVGGIVEFLGPGVGHVAQDGLDGLVRGEATWTECTQRGAGVRCEVRQTDYALSCESAGVSLAYAGRVAARVPVEVILNSVLFDMLEGTLPGASGSCLATCMAALRRPGCEACGLGEVCLDSAFGPVCQAAGPEPAGARCRAPSDCASLRCDEGTSRCG